jgi:hypothetical protein
LDARPRLSIVAARQPLALSAVRFAQRRGHVSAASERSAQAVSIMVFANSDEALAHDLSFALTFKVGKRQRPLDDQERRIVADSIVKYLKLRIGILSAGQD